VRAQATESTSITVVKKRRPERRDAILAAATTLFHERGYHETGMDDIGAAAGITGPAIYRHFQSKEDILLQILHDRADSALERAHEIGRHATSPLESLHELVTLYVDALLDNPSLAYVGLFERRTLSRETRAVIERIERLHAEEWVHALAQARPELSDSEARVMVHAVYGLAHVASIFRSGLGRDVLAPLIIDMIMGALLVNHR
jgi:AcrR family transcriptional regulator